MHALCTISSISSVVIPGRTAAAAMSRTSLASYVASLQRRFKDIGMTTGGMRYAPCTQSASSLVPPDSVFAAVGSGKRFQPWTRPELEQEGISQTLTFLGRIGRGPISYRRQHILVSGYGAALGVWGIEDNVGAESQRTRSRGRGWTRHLRQRQSAI